MFRKTDFYKSLNPMTATLTAEGCYEANEEQQLTAWQYLHDTGIAYQLQGFFGRTAQDLIAQNLIEQ